MGWFYQKISRVIFNSNEISNTNVPRRTLAPLFCGGSLCSHTHTQSVQQYWLKLITSVQYLLFANKATHVTINGAQQHQFRYQCDAKSPPVHNKLINNCCFYSFSVLRKKSITYLIHLWQRLTKLRNKYPKFVAAWHEQTHLQLFSIANEVCPTCVCESATATHTTYVHRYKYLYVWLEISRMNTLRSCGSLYSKEWWSIVCLIFPWWITSFPRPYSPNHLFHISIRVEWIYQPDDVDVCRHIGRLSQQQNTHTEILIGSTACTLVLQCAWYIPTCNLFSPADHFPHAWACVPVCVRGWTAAHGCR